MSTKLGVVSPLLRLQTEFIKSFSDLSGFCSRDSNHLGARASAVKDSDLATRQINHIGDRRNQFVVRLSLFRWGTDSNH
jgi:hypothetical protein